MLKKTGLVLSALLYLNSCNSHDIKTSKQLDLSKNNTQKECSLKQIYGGYSFKDKNSNEFYVIINDDGNIEVTNSDKDIKLNALINPFTGSANYIMKSIISKKDDTGRLYSNTIYCTVNEKGDIKKHLISGSPDFVNDDNLNLACYLAVELSVEVNQCLFFPSNTIENKLIKKI